MDGERKEHKIVNKQGTLALSIFAGLAFTTFLVSLLCCANCTACGGSSSSSFSLSSSALNI